MIFLFRTKFGNKKASLREGGGPQSGGRSLRWQGFNKKIRTFYINSHFRGLPSSFAPQNPPPSRREANTSTIFSKQRRIPFLATTIRRAIRAPNGSALGVNRPYKDTPPHNPTETHFVFAKILTYRRGRRPRRSAAERTTSRNPPMFPQPL